MLKRIAFLTLLNLSLAGLSAHADEVKLLETCNIDVSLELSEPTQIYCTGDLNIADGVQIVTNGHGLQIVVMGNVHYGAAGEGLQISSMSGPVFIYARTASGNLAILNQSQAADELGGNVEIEYGSSYNYAQTIEPGNAAEVRMVVAGQQLRLEGSQHRLPL